MAPAGPRGRFLLEAAAVLAVVAATRWPLAPKYLYYFDSVNFALALDHFDPRLHQPQPPGYPLYVGLARLVHWFVAAPEHVFVITGILAAAAALLLLRRLGDSLFGAPAGLLAAALLLFNPPFWLGGITNQVRLFLAAGAVAVAWLAWRNRFYAAAAALGIAAGFRPMMLPLMAPLLVWAGLRSHRRLREWMAAGALLSLTAGAWLAATMAASGGPRSWLDLLWGYANEQFAGSSLVFGSAAGAARRMFVSAVIWNGLGVLPWLWAVPFVRRAPFPASFLALWFAPAFLFQALVHIGDPDQALLTIPVLCLVGAFFLSRFRRGAYALAAAAALLNAALFLLPFQGVARAASIRAVRAVDRMTRSAFDALRELRAAGPITVVHYGSLVSWRQVSYYFPDEPLIVLQGTPGQSAAPPPLLLHDRRTRLESGTLVLPADRSVVWLLPPDPRWQRDLEKALPSSRHGPLLVSRLPDGGRFRFGAYGFFLRCESCNNQRAE